MFYVLILYNNVVTGFYIILSKLSRETKRAALFSVSSNQFKEKTNSLPFCMYHTLCGWSMVNFGAKHFFVFLVSTKQKSKFLVFQYMWTQQFMFTFLNVGLFIFSVPRISLNFLSAPISLLLCSAFFLHILFFLSFI